MRKKSCDGYFQDNEKTPKWEKKYFYKINSVIDKVLSTSAMGFLCDFSENN